MTDTGNYIGAGGARMEKPAEYYQRIDDFKKAKNSSDKANSGNMTNRVGTAGASQKIDKSGINKSGINKSQINKSQSASPSDITARTKPSSFEKMMRQNAANAKEREVQKRNQDSYGGLQNLSTHVRSVRNAGSNYSSGVKYGAQSTPGSSKSLSKMDIKQLQYDAARGSFSSRVKTQLAEQIDRAGRVNDLRDRKNGTDLALKELAIEYEEQIYGIMWNMVYSAGEREYQGGLGEEIFHKELVTEMLKFTNTGQMGQIAQSIYDDMKRTQLSNK